jgi:hypothetical protein
VILDGLEDPPVIRAQGVTVPLRHRRRPPERSAGRGRQACVEQPPGQLVQRTAYRIGILGLVADLSQGVEQLRRPALGCHVHPEGIDHRAR